MKKFSLIISFLFILQTTPFAQGNDLKANQVELNCKEADGITLLQWTSNREVNTSYYLIEKSVDGKAFETIGKVKAGSSTYSTTHYEFEDIAKEEIFVKYRLKLILMDGQSISILDHRTKPGYDLTKVGQ
ncbi:MAG: hypothetical protein RIC95_03915 [Vicingaceae bacterium]